MSCAILPLAFCVSFRNVSERNKNGQAVVNVILDHEAMTADHTEV